MNLRKIFKASVLGLAMVGSIAGLTGCGTSYSDAQKEGFYSQGDRVGVVTKLSYKGYRQECKTWEGEMAMDNFRSTGESTANSFAFTVKDPAVLKEVQDAQDSGARVKLHYNQVANHSLCESDTGYFVTGVKTLAPAANVPAPQPPGQGQ